MSNKQNLETPLWVAAPFEWLSKNMLIVALIVMLCVFLGIIFLGDTTATAETDDAPTAVKTIDKSPTIARLSEKQCDEDTNQCAAYMMDATTGICFIAMNAKHSATVTAAIPVDCAIVLPAPRVQEPPQ